MSGYHRTPPEPNIRVDDERVAATQPINGPPYVKQNRNAHGGALSPSNERINQPDAAPATTAQILRPSSHATKHFWTSNEPESRVKSPNYVETTRNFRLHPAQPTGDYSNPSAPTVHHKNHDQQMPSAHRSGGRGRGDREGAPFKPKDKGDRTSPNKQPSPDIQEQRKTSLWFFGVMGRQRGVHSEQEPNTGPTPASRGRADQRLFYSIKRVGEQIRDEEGTADDEMNHPKGKGAPPHGPSITTKLSNWLFAARDSSSEGTRLAKIMGKRRSNGDQVAAHQDASRVPPRMSLQESMRKRDGREEVPGFSSDPEARRRVHSTSGRAADAAIVMESSYREVPRERRPSNADRYSRDSRPPARESRRDSNQRDRRDSRTEYVRARDSGNGRRLSRSRSRSRDRREGANEQDSSRAARIPYDGNTDRRRERRSSTRDRSNQTSTPFPNELNSSEFLQSPVYHHLASSTSRGGRTLSQPFPADATTHHSRRGSISSIHSHDTSDNDGNRLVSVSRSRAGSRASASDMPPPSVTRSRAGSRVSATDVPTAVTSRNRKSSRASASDVPIIAPAPRHAVETPIDLSQSQPPSKRRSSPSRSRSREDDPVLRQNTLYNATSLKYQPERDGIPRKSALRRISNMDPLSYYLGGTGDYPGPSLPTDHADRQYHSDNSTRAPRMYPRRYTTPAVPYASTEVAPYSQAVISQIGRHPSMTRVYPQYGYPQEASNYYHR